MAAFRTFGISLLVTAAALAVGYAHGGAKDLFLLVVLAVLEVSLSFDNAIINAAILQRMSSFWRQMFLTVGILVAAFGMRLVFPLVIVWATARRRPGSRDGVGAASAAARRARIPGRLTQLREADHRRPPADRGIRRNVPVDAVLGLRLS
jgi:hypothetical protein